MGYIFGTGEFVLHRVPRSYSLAGPKLSPEERRIVEKEPCSDGGITTRDPFKVYGSAAKFWPAVKNMALDRGWDTIYTGTECCLCCLVREPASKRVCEFCTDDPALFYAELLNLTKLPCWYEQMYAPYVVALILDGNTSSCPQQAKEEAFDTGILCIKIKTYQDEIGSQRLILERQREAEAAESLSKTMGPVNDGLITKIADRIAKLCRKVDELAMSSEAIKQYVKSELGSQMLISIEMGTVEVQKLGDSTIISEPTEDELFDISNMIADVLIEEIKISIEDGEIEKGALKAATASWMRGQKKKVAERREMLDAVEAAKSLSNAGGVGGAQGPGLGEKMAVAGAKAAGKEGARQLLGLLM